MEMIWLQILPEVGKSIFIFFVYTHKYK